MNEFENILVQFMATPTQDNDWDLYYEDSGISEEEIAQLTTAFNIRLAVQKGATNVP